MFAFAHIFFIPPQRLLSKFPCKVEVACNGTEAVELAKNNKFDLILMDMIMPGEFIENN